MARVDLEFLARQLERVITDLAVLKDGTMWSWRARPDRRDAQSLVTLPSRHERLARRVGRLEDRTRSDG